MKKRHQAELMNCCKTHTRTGTQTRRVCVELQVEIDLVVTVAWQRRTSGIAKKRKNLHPSPLQSQTLEAFQKFFILYWTFWWSANCAFQDKSVKRRKPKTDSCYLQVEGSRVASWGMRRINLCLLFWPELEATSRFVQLSGTSSALILCGFILLWYYWNLSELS